RRSPERAMPEQAAAILAEGQVAHVGFCVAGAPYVLPFTYHYDAADSERLYLHGAPASRALRELAGGGPVCVTVTLLDGLVYSRSAKYHSANYRSVVAFGRARPITDPVEKAGVFERTILRYFQGRAAAVWGPRGAGRGRGRGCGERGDPAGGPGRAGGPRSRRLACRRPGAGKAQGWASSGPPRRPPAGETPALPAACLRRYGWAK